MTISFLLAIAAIAVLLALASVGVFALSTYRLRAASSHPEVQRTVKRRARAALLALIGILIGIFILLWAYHEFIILKGQVPS